MLPHLTLSWCVYEVVLRIGIQHLLFGVLSIAPCVVCFVRVICVGLCSLCQGSGGPRKLNPICVPFSTCLWMSMQHYLIWEDFPPLWEGLLSVSLNMCRFSNKPDAETPKGLTIQVKYIFLFSCVRQELVCYIYFIWLWNHKTRRTDILQVWMTFKRISTQKRFYCFLKP